VLLVYLNCAGLAIAGWALDPAEVPVESVPPAVHKLMKYATPGDLHADLASGLRLLTASLVSPGRARDD
jgi:hypothetical protein